MPDEKPVSRSLSVVDSALILAMFSAVCYVMGHAARIGTARRMRVPFILMPQVGPEVVILIGGIYLVLLAAGGLLLYFVYVLLAKRTALLGKTVGRTLSGIRSRAEQHPRVYFLLASLAAITIMYTVPLSLPFTPRSAGGPSAFGGQAASDVVALLLKNSEGHAEGKTLRYLWPAEGVVVLQDKKSGELLLIDKDEVRLMILTPPGIEHTASKPSNNEMQRTRPAQATEPRR